MKKSVPLLVLVTLLLASCANTVRGTARMPSALPPPKTEQAGPDPCALLTPAEAGQLGLSQKGKFTEGSKAQLVPPMCMWRPADPDADVDPLSVGLSADLAIEEYFASKQPVEQLELGGVTWGRYESTFGDSICNLAVKLSDLSFVVIAGGNSADSAKACDVPKEAAPLVAKRLPGR